MNETSYCRYCKSETLNFFSETQDYHYNNDGKWKTYRCSTCKHIFELPVMNDSDLSKFYPTDYYSFKIEQSNYESNNIFRSPFLTIQKHFLKHFKKYEHLNVSGNFFLAYLYKILKPKPFFYRDPEFVENGKILDYGCGAGHYVSFLKYLGWNSEGIEISKQAAENAIQNNLNVRCGSIEQLEGYTNYYDVIYSCHALEHVSKIDELFKKMYESLKPGGYLVFDVPNGNASAIDIYKDFYFYFGLPVHINLFTGQSATSALTNAGFNNITFKTYSIWSTQIASYFTRLKNANSQTKVNLGTHSKIEQYIGYILTFLPYLKSLRKGKGDNLVVIAKK